MENDKDTIQNQTVEQDTDNQQVVKQQNQSAEKPETVPPEVAGKVLSTLLGQPAEPSQADDKPKEPTPPPAPAKRIKKAKDYPEIDPEKIAEAAARGVAKALKDKDEKTKTPPPAQPAEEEIIPPDKLPEEDRQAYEVIVEMANLYPDKYKDYPQKALKFKATLEKDADTFRDKWEKANPPENFASDEERNAAMAEAWNEHAANLRQKIGFNYSQADFEKAQEQLKLKPIASKVQELEQTVKQAKLKEVQPKIMQTALSAAADVVNEMVGKDAFDEVFKDGKFSRDKLTELAPESAEIIESAAQAAAVFAATVESFINGLADERQTDAVVSAVANIEKYITSLPEEEQKDGQGRQFISVTQYNKLSDAEKAKRWTLDPQTLIAINNHLILEEAKEKAQQEQERIQKIVERKYGLQKPGKADKAAEIALNSPPPMPPPAASKPLSPSTAAAPVATKTTTQSGGLKGPGSKLLNALLNGLPPSGAIT